MFSFAFIISLIRVATFVIVAALVERIYFNRKLNLEQKSVFKYNSRSNVSAYIIIALSIATILNITEDSYVFKVNSIVAIYAPWLFIFMGLFIYVRNLKYNTILRNKILEK